RLQLLDAAPAGTAQRPVDQLARAHLEPRVTRVEPPRQRADDLVVGAAFAGRLDQLGPELDVLVAAALVEVVVLEKHGRGQGNVGHAGGLGHELLVYADEQVLAGKAALDEILLRRDRHRIGVLDDQRGDRRATKQGLRLADQERSDAPLARDAAPGVAG